MRLSFRVIGGFIAVYLLLFGISTYNGLIKYHPYQIAYYNELIGRINGVFKKEMETDYWGSAYKDVLEWLNKQGKCKIHIYENPFPFLWYHEDNVFSRGVTLDTVKLKDVPLECIYRINNEKI